MFRPIWLTLLLLASPALAQLGPEEEDGVAFAACRPEPAGCHCSFVNMESDFSFAQAADAVLIYYRRVRDDRFALLMQQLLRQCAGEDPPPVLFPQAGPPPSKRARSAQARP